MAVRQGGMVDDEDGEQRGRKVASQVLLHCLIAAVGNNTLNTSKWLEKRIFKNSNTKQLCVSGISMSVL